MGNSANMKVVNVSNLALQTFVTDVECMYDNGQEGSNLSAFNDTNIGPGVAYPSDTGQFIETKNSGSCFGVTSTFDLVINDLNTSQEIGQVNFEENGGWYYKCTNPSAIHVDISGDPTMIAVTVQQPPSEGHNGR
ncbi:hypothetical protein GCM10010271_26430 [Streptomyces kurssanovii]|nr:hypothetical protein GCM10010271_26430 [Streptomyces kurssanovii]